MILRIFGFEITRVSKLNDDMIKSFEELVKLLQNNSKEYIDFLNGLPMHIDILFNPETADSDEERYDLINQMVNLISIRTNQIIGILRLYQEHRLSDLLTGSIYMMTIPKLNAQSAKLQALLKAHIDMENRMSDASNNQDVEFDNRYEVMLNKYEELLKYEHQCINETISDMLLDLHKIRTQGKYDVFEIQFGVDLIRTRLKRKKIKEPKNEPRYIIKIFDNNLGVDKHE